MDNQRFILYVGLALVLYLIWNAWQREHLIPVETITEQPIDTQIENNWQEDIPKPTGLPVTENKKGTQVSRIA